MVFVPVLARVQSRAWRKPLAYHATESTGYKVFDQFFPATYVNEHDLLDALVAAGFPEEGIHIEVEMMDDWTEQGFSGICLAHAER